tara:strand:- start:2269 stop:2472 length:204 start_codon:yes stop_codon:yes gene_type:complete
MEKYTLADVGILITTISGAVVLILGALQKSKCSKINLCCLKCDRDPTLKTDASQMTPRLPSRPPDNP